jgi:hypothetical protein
VAIDQNPLKKIKKTLLLRHTFGHTRHASRATQQPSSHASFLPQSLRQLGNGTSDHSVVGVCPPCELRADPAWRGRRTPACAAAVAGRARAHPRAPGARHHPPQSTPPSIRMAVVGRGHAFLRPILTMVTLSHLFQPLHIPWRCEPSWRAGPAHESARRGQRGAHRVAGGRPGRGAAPGDAPGVPARAGLSAGGSEHPLNRGVKQSTFCMVQP